MTVSLSKKWRDLLEPQTLVPISWETYRLIVSDVLLSSDGNPEGVALKTFVLPIDRDKLLYCRKHENLLNALELEIQTDCILTETNPQELFTASLYLQMYRTVGSPLVFRPVGLYFDGEEVQLGLHCAVRANKLASTLTPISLSEAVNQLDAMDRWAKILTAAELARRQLASLHGQWSSQSSTT